VGRTLARALGSLGYPVTGLVGRADDPTPLVRADLVLLTVPDDEIAPAFAKMAQAGALRESQIVMHCSGLVTSDVLRAPGLDPAGRAAMHPMMAFAQVERAIEALPGITYAVEGDDRGVEAARLMILDLGGVIVEVPAGAKAAYHLACVMASNGLVALTDAAVEITRRAGVQDENMSRGLAHLVMCTAGNMARLGIRPAMTGPVVRGDADSVARHLEILKADHPDILEAYRPLMKRLVAMAVESGRGSDARYERIRALLED
jgi:predicted short-subunit dehydrogenase-like oxidoreductase (DUF2520 family)